MERKGAEGEGAQRELRRSALSTSRGGRRLLPDRGAPRTWYQARRAQQCRTPGKRKTELSRCAVGGVGFPLSLALRVGQFGRAQRGAPFLTAHMPNDRLRIRNCGHRGRRAGARAGARARSGLSLARLSHTSGGIRSQFSPRVPCTIWCSVGCGSRTGGSCGVGRGLPRRVRNRAARRTGLCMSVACDDARTISGSIRDPHRTQAAGGIDGGNQGVAPAAPGRGASRAIVDPG